MNTKNLHYQDRNKLKLPEGTKKLLLQSCCAPCSCEIIEALVFSEIDFTIFFYNPNIHPIEEYEKRKEENKLFAKKYNISFVDADYDVDKWFEKTKGFEDKPERGERCTICFDVRLERTALYAYENDFDVFATTLSISRWKDLEQVHKSGFRVAEKYPSVIFWDKNWRKQNGSQRGMAIAKEECFYRQQYCGCVFSMRDVKP